MRRRALLLLLVVVAGCGEEPFAPSLASVGDTSGIRLESHMEAGTTHDLMVSTLVGRNDLAGLQASVHYDPTALRFFGPRAETRTVMVVDDRSAADGVVRFLAVRVGGLSEDPPALTFEVLRGAVDPGVSLVVELAVDAAAPDVVSPGSRAPLLAPGDFEAGDCTMDGSIDVFDTLATARISIGLDPVPSDPTHLLACDASEDGVVNVLDTFRIAAMTVAAVGSRFPGFATIYDEPWDDFDRYAYWTRDGTSGQVTANGTLTWVYPAGFPGGYVPRSRVIRMNTPGHGPYQYHRDEGVTLSGNWVGHVSGVNKFRFWSRPNEEIHGYLMFEGSGSRPLRPAINTQGFPMTLEVLRWNHPDNLAHPSDSQTRVVRGVPHTVETLMYKGSPGSWNGWVKVWLDGVLVLHFANRRFTAWDEQPTFGPIHFAPYWGGAGGSLYATQTLSVDRSLVAWSATPPS